MGSTMVKKYFLKFVPRPFGVHKQRILGYFERYLPHISPCKFPKTSELVLGGWWRRVLCCNVVDCDDPLGPYYVLFGHTTCVSIVLHTLVGVPHPLVSISLASSFVGKGLSLHRNLINICRTNPTDLACPIASSNCSIVLLSHPRDTSLGHHRPHHFIDVMSSRATFLLRHINAAHADRWHAIEGPDEIPPYFEDALQAVMLLRLGCKPIEEHGV